MKPTQNVPGSFWVGLIFLLAGCGGTPRAPRGAELEIGAAEVDITPPRPMRMSGYFHERISTGTKDPLKAKALVFGQDETRAAFVFCDLVGVPVGVSFRARQQAAAKTGIPAAHIVVAATHSHTGPLYYGALHRILRERAGPKDPLDFDYAPFLVAKITEAVVNADRARRPARLETGSVRVDGLAFHRRFRMKDGTLRTNPGSLNPDILEPAGTVDPDLGLLLARDASGPLATLAVFGLHCDTTGGTEFSADYPATLERALHDGLSTRLVSCFGAGPCGNINHIDVTKKERARPEAIGARLARAVIEASPRLRPVAPALAVANARVDLPLQRYPAEMVDHARQNTDKIGGKELPFLDQVRICSILHLQDLPTVLPLEVQAFRLAPDVALVTLPGEVFVELGLAIKHLSPFRTTLVVELANDNPAYIPTRTAFEAGGYEVVNSRIEAGGGERLVDTALRLLNDLKP
jgi:neutral ceramidase